MKTVKRTYVDDELESIDSNGSYNNKSTSIRRVCIKLATINTVNDIEVFKKKNVSKSLGQEERQKMLDAIDMIEENKRGIQESRNPWAKFFWIGQHRPESGSDSNDEEAGRHI